MVLAGETAIAGKVPGERIATTIRTATSANITTTETVVDTVVAPVVIGRVYRITWDCRPNASVSGDDLILRIREDAVAGNELRQATIDITVANRFSRLHTGVEYTADATEDKTFVATLIRLTGTGNATTTAAAFDATYLYVDYIRGP